MNPALIDAAVRLAALLARENEALLALDLPRAAGLLEEKQRAAAAFEIAQSQESGASALARAEQMSASRDLAERLDTLARENRRLLERAIGVQGRVLGLLAQAARPAVATGYGANGDATRARQATPLALAARI